MPYLFTGWQTRFTGWVLLLAGFGLGLRDALAPWLDHRHFHPISFGAVIAWSQIGPVLADSERLLTRYLIEPLAGYLAMVWAFVARQFARHGGRQLSTLTVAVAH